MNEMFYRQSALDCIANGLLKNYRNGMYLYGAPRSIPIEEIIEVEYKLTIEYVKLRKSGNVLGQTVFENCFVPVYDKENEQYTIIEVQPGTILIDEALLEEEFRNESIETVRIVMDAKKGEDGNIVKDLPISYNPEHRKHMFRKVTEKYRAVREPLQCHDPMAELG